MRETRDGFAEVDLSRRSRSCFGVSDRIALAIRRRDLHGSLAQMHLVAAHVHKRVSLL